MTQTQSPLGRHLRISHGSHTATIMEVGASLYSYEVEGRLAAGGPNRPSGTVDVHKGSRGAILMPWPNRIAQGKYKVNGDTLQLPITEAATGHATHGFVRADLWKIEEHSESSLTASIVVYAQPGWPFVFEARITYRLDSEGLTVEMQATNRGEQRFPFVMGVHPYFTAGADYIDSCQLTVPGASRLILDDKLIPTGKAEVENSEFDFRTGRLIADMKIDVTYANLSRDPDGIATAILEDPSTGHGVKVWMDSNFGYLQIFSGDTLALEDDRRRTLAIEAMTGAPNAFNSGDGLLWVEPGTSVNGIWGVNPF